MKEYIHTTAQESVLPNLKTDLTCRFSQQIPCKFVSEGRRDNEFGYVAVNSKVKCYSLKNSVRIIDREFSVRGSIKLAVEKDFPLVSVFQREPSDNIFYLAVGISDSKFGIYKVSLILEGKEISSIEPKLMHELSDIVSFHWLGKELDDGDFLFVTLSNGSDGDVKLGRWPLDGSKPAETHSLWSGGRVLDSDLFGGMIIVLFESTADEKSSIVLRSVDFASPGKFSDIPFSISAEQKPFRLFRFNGSDLSESEEHDLILGSSKNDRDREGSVALVTESADNNTILSLYSLDAEEEGMILQQTLHLPVTAVAAKIFVDRKRRTAALASTVTPIILLLTANVDSEYPIGTVSEFATSRPIGTMGLGSEVFKDYEAHGITETEDKLIDTVALTIDPLEVLLHHIPSFRISTTSRSPPERMQRLSALKIGGGPAAGLNDGRDMLARLISSSSRQASTPSTPEEDEKREKDSVEEEVEVKDEKSSTQKEVTEKPKDVVKEGKKAEPVYRILAKPKSENEKSEDGEKREERNDGKEIEEKGEKSTEAAIKGTADAMNLILDQLMRSSEQVEETSISKSSQEESPVEVSAPSPKQEAKTSPKQKKAVSVTQAAKKASVKVPPPKPSNPPFSIQLMDPAVVKASKSKEEKDPLAPKRGGETSKRDKSRVVAKQTTKNATTSEAPKKGKKLIQGPDIGDAKRPPLQSAAPLHSKEKEDIFWYRETKRLHGILLGKLEKQSEKQQKTLVDEVVARLSKESKKQVGWSSDDHRKAVEEATKVAITNFVFPYVTKQMNGIVQEQNKVIKDAIKRSFETLLIPTIERAVREMMNQVGESLKEMVKTQGDKQERMLNSLIDRNMNQLSGKTSEMMGSLSKELTDNLARHLSEVKADLDSVSVRLQQSSSQLFSPSMMSPSAMSFATVRSYIDMGQYDLAIGMAISSNNQRDLDTVTEFIEKKDVIPPRGPLRISQDMLLRMIESFALGIGPETASKRLEWLNGALVRLEPSANSRYVLHKVVQTLIEKENIIKIEDFEQYLFFVQLAKAKQGI